MTLSCIGNCFWTLISAWWWYCRCGIYSLFPWNTLPLFACQSDHHCFGWQFSQTLCSCGNCRLIVQVSSCDYCYILCKWCGTYLAALLSIFKSCWLRSLYAHLIASQSSACLHPCSFPLWPLTCQCERTQHSLLVTLPNSCVPTYFSHSVMQAVIIQCFLALRVTVMFFCNGKLLLSCTNAVPLYRFQFIDNKAASASIFSCKVCMYTAVHNICMWW